MKTLCTQIPKLKMDLFQLLEESTKINVFKYVSRPIELALTCRYWFNIAKTPQAKAEWVVEKYKEKRKQTLFYAVRLGPIFINVELCEILIKKKNVIISKCFIEKLLKHFGPHDPELIKCRVDNKVDHQFEKSNSAASSWASNLPFPVFKYLLHEGYNNCNNDPTLYEMDMELFSTWNVGDGRENQYLDRANLPLVGE